MSDKYEVILGYEQQFAKNLALRLRAERRQPIWQFFIPFKFAFEFLSAKRDMQAFTESFTYIRKLALNTARWTAGPEESQERIDDLENTIRKWLTSREAYSEEMLEAQMELVVLLLEHYSHLLQADGDDYPILVKNAYQSRPAAYESLLRKLSDAENRADRALVAILGESEQFTAEIEQKQAALYDLRTREMREIFI